MYYTYARTYVHRCVAAIVAGRFFFSPKVHDVQLASGGGGGDGQDTTAKCGWGGRRSFDISTIIFAAVRRRVGDGVLSCTAQYSSVNG